MIRDDSSVSGASVSPLDTAPAALPHLQQPAANSNMSNPISHPRTAAAAGSPARAQPSERTPLLHNHRPAQQEAPPPQQEEQEDSIEADPQMPPYRVLVPVLTAVWSPVFISALDSTIIATLLTSIASDFRSSEQAAWLGSAFLVSLCCFTPIYGR